MLWRAAHPLVLASHSAIRRKLLESAGIPVEVSVVDLDERAIEARGGPLSPTAVAILLARAKAQAVATALPGQLVLGADQTLAFGARRFTKPPDIAAAREQLRILSGQTHELCSAFAIVRDRQVIFSHCEIARMTMRPLSAAFLDAYLAAAGPGVCASVGAYQLENLGIHLFERIEGDHFTILGLPLMPLFDYLRREGFVAA